jgi:hypothetical protein
MSAPPAALRSARRTTPSVTGLVPVVAQPKLTARHMLRKRGNKIDLQSTHGPNFVDVRPARLQQCKQQSRRRTLRIILWISRIRSRRRIGRTQRNVAGTLRDMRRGPRTSTALVLEYPHPAGSQACDRTAAVRSPASGSSTASIARATDGDRDGDDHRWRRQELSPGGSQGQGPLRTCGGPAAGGPAAPADCPAIC